MVRGASGQVWSWGLGGNGQLGYDVPESQIQPTPRIVEGIPPLFKLFAGSDHSGGLDGTALWAKLFFFWIIETSAFLTIC